MQTRLGCKLRRVYDSAAQGGAIVGNSMRMQADRAGLAKAKRPRPETPHFTLAADLGGMAEAGMLATPDGFPASFMRILAVILLLMGIFAIASMLFRIGPFI